MPPIVLNFSLFEEGTAYSFLDSPFLFISGLFLKCFLTCDAYLSIIKVQLKDDPMIVAKQVADLITSVRVLIAVFLVFVGVVEGNAGLPLVAWMMIADWAGDMVDGRIARRSRVQYHTWIGDHDLEVDITVSVGLLAYLVKADFLNIWLAGGYVFLWGLYFWRQGGIPHSAGMLLQAPIYAWFIFVALRDAPQAGWTIVVFLTSAIVLTWPYFPKVMVPGFFAGFRKEK